MIAIDGDGEIVGRPVEWNEGAKGPAPTILLHASENHSPGIGDRVMAKLIANGPAAEHGYRGKVIRVLSNDIGKVIGTFRKSSGAGGRIVPSGKKDRDEYDVPKGDEEKLRNSSILDFIRIFKRII